MTIAETLLATYCEDKDETSLDKAAKTLIHTMSRLTVIHTIWVFQDDSYIVKAYLAHGNDVQAHLATPDPKWVRTQFKQWLIEAEAGTILYRLFSGNANRIKSSLRKLPLTLQP